MPARPALAGQPWAALSVPSVHPGRVGSSGHRDDAACAVRAEVREQRAACRAAVELCVEGGTPSLLPGDPLCHEAFPTQLAVVLLRGTERAGVQQLL